MNINLMLEDICPEYEDNMRRLLAIADRKITVDAEAVAAVLTEAEAPYGDCSEDVEYGIARLKVEHLDGRIKIHHEGIASGADADKLCEALGETLETLFGKDAAIEANIIPEDKRITVIIYESL